MLMLMLVTLACTFALSASAATTIQLTTADLTYPSVSGVYTANEGTSADVTADFAVKAGWKLASAPDAKVEVAVKKATLASTARGETTVTVEFALTGADAASYTVENLVVPAKVVAANDVPAVGVGNLVVNGSYYKDGVYTTEYNGADKLDVKANITLDTTGLTFPAGVGVAIDTAKLNAATVTDAKYVTVTFKLVDLDANDGVDATVGYQAPNPVVIPAKVTPKALAWASGSINVAFDLEYNKTAYGIDVKNLLPALTGFVGSDTANVVSASKTVYGVEKAGTYSTTVDVVIDNANYTVGAVTVGYTVNRMVLTVDWSTVLSGYRYGDKTVFGIESVKAALGTTGPAFYLPVSVWNEDGSQTVANFVGNVGKYRFQGSTPDVDKYEIANVFTTFEITPITYDVSMDDITYIGNADNTSGNNEAIYQLLVSGNLPKEIRDLIKYYVNGEEFTGTSAYGVYEVKAVLPTSANYSFTVNGQPVVGNELTATMCINRKYIATGPEADKYAVVVVGKYGFSSAIKVEVTDPGFDRTVLRGYPIHSERSHCYLDINAY